MAVINQIKLECSPVIILYNYVINKMYGMDCNPNYTIAKAYEAYRDYWVYNASVNCDNSCAVEEIIKRSNYGCDTISVCTDKTINCNVTLSVDPNNPPCREININVS